MPGVELGGMKDISEDAVSTYNIKAKRGSDNYHSSCFKLSQFTSQKLFNKPNVSTADCCLLQWLGIQYVGVGFIM